MLAMVFAVPSRSGRLWKSSANSCLCMFCTQTSVFMAWVKSSPEQTGQQAGGSLEHSPSRLGFTVVTGTLGCHCNTNATLQISLWGISPAHASTSTVFESCCHTEGWQLLTEVVVWDCKVLVEPFQVSVSETGKIADAKLCNY